jgi:hypothetical protein
MAVKHDIRKNDVMANEILTGAIIWYATLRLT